MTTYSQSAAQPGPAAYAQFAIWLQKNHPALFNTLLIKSQQTAQRATFGFLGDDDLDFIDTGDASYLSTDDDTLGLPISGADSMLSDITVTGTNSSSDPVTETEIEDLTANAATIDPTSGVTLPTPSLTSSQIPTAPVTAPTSAASAVGNYLTTPAGAATLTAALVGANQIISSNAVASTIEAQAARAAAGLSPANVTYAASTDPMTGTTTAVPVLNTSTGQIPLAVSATSLSSILQNYGLWIILGLGVLFATSD